MNKENLTEKELFDMPKEELVGMVLGMQSNVNELKRTINLLSERVNIMNQRSYGRKSETVSPLQLELELSLNEAEALSDPQEKEPALEEAAPKKKRPAGKRKEDLEKITEHRTVPVEIPEEELNSRFGEGNWKRLPEQIITKIPAPQGDPDAPITALPKMRDELYMPQRMIRRSSGQISRKSYGRTVSQRRRWSHLSCSVNTSTQCRCTDRNRHMRIMM